MSETFNSNERNTYILSELDENEYNSLMTDINQIIDDQIVLHQARRRERYQHAHNRLVRLCDEARVPRFFYITDDCFDRQDMNNLEHWNSKYGKDVVSGLRKRMRLCHAAQLSCIAKTFIDFEDRPQDFRESGNRQRSGTKMSEKRPSSSWLGKCVSGWMGLLFPSSDDSDIITRQLVESLLYAFVLKTRGHNFTHKETQRCTNSFKVLVSRMRDLRGDDCEDFDLLKYWTNFWLWKLSGGLEDPPEKPQFAGTHLFTGWMRLFVARRLVKKDYSFFLSWQQSKRFWPQLSKKKEFKALLKHQQLLSTKKSDLPLETVRQIKQTCNTIFFNKRATGNFTKLCPSRSACLQSSRSDGGALALYSVFSPVLQSPTLKKVIGATGAMDLSLREWREDVFETAISRITQPLSYFSSHDTHKEYYNESIIDLETKVRIIPEPAKFRPITMMDGNLATALQPMQGDLISCWKRTRWNTMGVEVSELVQKIEDSSSEPLWCSGDYQASTDHLCSEASEIALRFYLDRVQSPIPDQMVVNSLCSTLINYPTEDYADIEEEGRHKMSFFKNSLKPSVLQRNGQLMGHPLSFPLLCAINLAYYFTAIEHWSRTLRGTKQDRARVKAMRRNVIINGDDILFKCDRAFFLLWKKVTAEGGLLLSPGKCYLSEDLAQINSQTFVRRSGKMVRIGYLNLKLVLGYSLKAGETDVQPEQIGKDLSAMVDLAPWTRASLPLAFAKWEDRFGGRFRPNWFLPAMLGGYGVSPRWALSEDIGITKWQRKVASMFVNDPKLALTRNVFKRPDLPDNLRKAIPPCKFVRFGDEAEVGTEPLSSEWIGRISLCSSLMTPKPMKPDQFFFREARGWMSAKPMSIKKIISYLSGEWYYASRPPPPRLLDVGFARLTTAEKRPNGRRFVPRSSRVSLDFCEGYSPKTQNDPMCGLAVLKTTDHFATDPNERKLIFTTEIDGKTVVLETWNESDVENQLSSVSRPLREIVRSSLSHWSLHGELGVRRDPGVLNKKSRDCTASDAAFGDWESYLERCDLENDGQSAQAGPCRNQKPTRARQARREGNLNRVKCQ